MNGFQTTVGSDQRSSEEVVQERIDNTEKQLNAQLNYGGMLVNGELTSDRISMGWRGGEINDEINQMRRIAEAFLSLANALESSKNT